MTGTMITQPAMTGVAVRTRPTRLVAFGKLVGMVVALGTALALALAAGIGLVALVLTSASG